MTRAALAAAAAASLALAAFWLGRATDAGDVRPARTASSAASSAGPVADTALAALAEELEAEREAREALEADVAWLEARLDALDPAAAADAAESGAAAAGEAPADVSGAPSSDAAGDEDDDARWFDERVLLDVGLRPADAAALRELYEEVELERLYLRDTAQREAWPPAQLRRELRALDHRLASVRGDWGEPVYDWFLYASGRTNRVLVESVLGSSPASDAGIRSGDAILSYDGRRVFDPTSLRRATNAGTLGETVVVEVVRGASVQRLEVPRGPLGVRLDTVRVPPRPL